MVLYLCCCRFENRSFDNHFVFAQLLPYHCLIKPNDMKKMIALLMFVAALAACNGGTADSETENYGPDTAPVNTTPRTGNQDATMGQQIPRDSVELSSDSTGNIRPGDTTKN